MECRKTEALVLAIVTVHGSFTGFNARIPGVMRRRRKYVVTTGHTLNALLTVAAIDGKSGNWPNFFLLDKGPRLRSLHVIPGMRDATSAKIRGRVKETST